jgi:hypothetical protein
LVKLANSFISEISIAPLAGWLVRVIIYPTPFARVGYAADLVAFCLTTVPTPVQIESEVSQRV